MISISGDEEVTFYMRCCVSPSSCITEFTLGPWTRLTRAKVNYVEKETFQVDNNAGCV